MSYNFGRTTSTSPTNNSSTGMYENLPTSRSASRRQGRIVDSGNGIGTSSSTGTGSGRESLPVPPRRRPFLNEAGQSGLLMTSINHSPNGSRRDSTGTKNPNYSSTANSSSKSSEGRHNEKMDDGDGDSHSGGLARFTRAKSEKREIVDREQQKKDRWFTQSFASGGGGSLHKNNVVGGDDEDEDDDDAAGCSSNPSDSEAVSVAERKRMFEAQIAELGGGSCMSSSAKSQNDNRYGSNSSSRTAPHEHQTQHQHQRMNSPTAPSHHPCGGDKAPRQQLLYRGSKTTPNLGTGSNSSDEWDFIATLNEILRRENFLQEEDVDYGKMEYPGGILPPPQSGSDCKHVPLPHSAVGCPSDHHHHHHQFNNKGDTPAAVARVGGRSGSSPSASSGNNTSAGAGQTPTAPMSPRPPRPNRLRAAERRKEYARTRSLDAGHFGLVTNGLSAPNNNNNHLDEQLHGSHNEILSGSSIDLSSTGCNAMLGVAGGSIVGGYSANRQNQQQHQSGRAVSSSSPFSNSCGDNGNKGGGGGGASSCITIVENPFQQLSNSLSVLPLPSKNSQLVEQQRQALRASPVTSSSLMNASPSSNNFSPFITSQPQQQQPPPLNSNVTGENRPITPRHPQQQQNRMTTLVPLNSPFLFQQQHPQQPPQHHHHYLLSPLAAPQSSAARVTRSPLLNTVSSSLDSIYERLKANEYLDQIGPSRPLTQVYFDRNFGVFSDYYGVTPQGHGEDGNPTGFCQRTGGGSAGNNVGYTSQPNLAENGGRETGTDIDGNFYPPPPQQQRQGEGGSNRSMENGSTMGKNGCVGGGGGGVGPPPSDPSSSTAVNANPNPTDSSGSTITRKVDSSSSLEENSNAKTNKTCQSTVSGSSQSTVSLSTQTIPATNFLSSPSSPALGGKNNLSCGLSPSTSSSSGVGLGSKSVAKVSSAISSGVGSLFTGLGAKIPVISPAATAALEKHLKGLQQSAEKTGGGGGEGNGDGIDENNIANNNNNSKRSSKNVETVTGFLSVSSLPPIPPTPGNSTNLNVKEASSSSFSLPLSSSKPSVIRVSLPTKSSKSARLKSPSRRKSTVSSPPPTFDDMAVGGGGGSCSGHHHAGSAASISGKTGRKKLAGSKRYASSLPDRERCLATSPVAFDLNSYLCHSQGPIDFTSLLSRVHQQQQLLQLSQQQHHHHAPPPHIIHHPQPTLPFMGHPKPTKHCKNKHMWARASVEREVYNGATMSSPTPSASGTIGCNNLSNSNSSSSVLGGDNSKASTCSSKMAVGGAALPPNPSNRHSSYHPSYGLGSVVGDSSGALQAAAAAYNAHLLFSRPTSPLFLGDSASCCSDYGGTYCAGCAAKTFARRAAAAAQGAHHGMCFCCHQNGSGSVNQVCRAATSTPGVCGGSEAGGSLLGLDYEDRLLRLESDKDTLHLQVSVLSDQIEAQTNKIHDLEKMLDDKRNTLESTEDQLNRIFAESFDTFKQELLLRSSLETQKLELMTEISSLRLKHASLERENVELKDRVVGKSTGDLSYIDGCSQGGGSRIWDKPPIGPERAVSPTLSLGIDPSILAAAARARLGSGGSEHQNYQQPQKTRTPPANAYRRVDQSAFGTIPRRSPHSSQLSANNTASFNGSILGGGGHLGTGGGGGMGGAGDPHGKSSAKANSLSSGNIHAISNFSTGLHQLKQQQKTLQEQQLLLFHQHQMLLSSSAQNKLKPFPSSGESHNQNQSDNDDDDDGDLQHANEDDANDNDGVPFPPNNNDSCNNNDSHLVAFSSSPPSQLEQHQPTTSQFLVESPPLCSPSSETFSSPPNNRRSRSGAWAYRKARHVIAPAPGSSGGGGGGAGFVSSISRIFNPRSGCRSTSTPNLVTITDNEQWNRKTGGLESNNGTSNKTKQSPSGNHKSRGILRILGKLRRSNSGGLDNDVAPSENTFASATSSGGPFVRGGVRATAHPRLGWMKDPSPIIKKPDGPVNSWDSDAVITWLNYLGLGTYAGEVKRWVKSGQQLLDASNHELEKELGIKNNLHRKKLSLALHSLKHPEEEDSAGKLDYHWVVRWLDDVGLPQYKESFMDARIDGRVLGHLTAEDLVSLKVTSVLHHASLKRGIQLLRIHKFHPDCLCRRGGPNPGAVSNGHGGTATMTASTTGSSEAILLGNSNGGTNGTGGGDHASPALPPGSVWGPRHVATWTNHRVMEWLKAIDLAEYAPNLRGSGVHGALIIFEPRFNSELMATLLAIPGNKTLLRRHLSLQFNELVGRLIVQEKRVSETATDFIPLNPTTKVKLPKKSQFPLRKKRLSTEMTEDLLCPPDLSTYPFGSDSVAQLTTGSTTTTLIGGGGGLPVNERSVDGTKTVGEEKVSDI